MSNFSNFFRRREHEGGGTHVAGLRVLAMTLLCLFQGLFPMQKAVAQGKTVNINKQQATVQEILSEIKQQTGLSFVFDVEDVALDRKVNVSALNKPVTDVLAQMFDGTGISYVIKENHIVLTKAASASATGPFNVKGTIRDASGNPMIGVAVVVVASGRGTTTGAAGEFELKVNDGDVLNVSYIGYKSRQLSVRRSQSVMNIVLEEDATMVDEVVVTALGIKRKSKALGYNVQEVKGEEIAAVKDANFMNSLVGKVAGLNISNSGGVGGATKVIMRGTKSLSKDNNALYVIDGVPLIFGLYVVQPEAQAFSRCESSSSV